jgi:cytochrome c-type biogenesis protein CcmH
MTERYGDFVLYRPPFNMQTILLWFTPVLALLIGALGFMSILNRRETNADEQLSKKELARIKELLHLKSNKE